MTDEQQTQMNAEAISETLEMMQREVHRQEAVRATMEKQIKKAMGALTTAGEGVWEEIRTEGADIAMTLVQDMRESHVDMIMDLSQQVSLIASRESQC
jgi:hypothetical protein